ncbi:MAG TPA: DM13 domain-containing protein [Chitinophagaceae bacterium]|nr:DM13 domain-containing protein [Chitinophagaceae bacterium]
MRLIICFLTIQAILLVCACKKESTSGIPIIVDSGYFSNGPYGSVSGTAKIYKTGTQYELALENFSSSNGPDLKVYLSKEKQPVNFVSLGPLKSTAGDQLYTIPAAVNVSEYKFALIHCEKYNHLFGFTQLRQ